MDLINCLLEAKHFGDFIASTNKILISAFLGAELLKQAWKSTYKSYVITKRRLKIIGMTEKIKWSHADLNRRPPACHAGALPAELWPQI